MIGIFPLSWLPLGIWLPLMIYLVVELFTYWIFARSGDDIFLAFSAYITLGVIGITALIMAFGLIIDPRLSIPAPWSRAMMDFSSSSEFWLATILVCSVIGLILIALGVNDSHHIALTVLFTFSYLFFYIRGVLSPVSDVVTDYAGWANCLAIASVATYFLVSVTPYARRQREDRLERILDMCD